MNIEYQDYEMAMLTDDNGDLDALFVSAPPDVERRHPDELVTVYREPGHTPRIVRAGHVALHPAPIGWDSQPKQLGEFELWLPACAYCDTELAPYAIPVPRHLPDPAGPHRNDHICRWHPRTDRPRPHLGKYRVFNSVTGAVFAASPNGKVGARLRSRERGIARFRPNVQAGLQQDALVVAKQRVETATTELSCLARDEIADRIRSVVPDATHIHVDLGGWFENNSESILLAVYDGTRQPVWHDNVHGPRGPHGLIDDHWTRQRADVETIVDIVLEVANPATAGWPHYAPDGDENYLGSDAVYEITFPPAARNPVSAQRPVGPRELKGIALDSRIVRPVQLVGTGGHTRRRSYTVFFGIGM
ncbi:hypothetical protein [Amycolatopsis anabasis]|uniref:hypothetical protein n=1 Tax=Amycolatopsis anabasis TaxID=1840409 RepID=UPI00131D4D26|nr:hypothetical protein [Amycolatopsis anabasis]